LSSISCRWSATNPSFFRCLQCNELLKPEVNYFSLERGGTFCPTHGAGRQDSVALPLPVLKVLRYLQTRPWEQVAGLQLGPLVSQQVESLLARYIVHHLERTLSSPAFLLRLRSQLAAEVQRSDDGDS